MTTMLHKTNLKLSINYINKNLVILKLTKNNEQQNTRVAFMKVFDIFAKYILFYPTSGSLSYLWGFGSLAGLMLAIQLITGVILAMHFQPAASLAFESVLRIVNDVPNGWCLRSLHANGASFFFLVVYIHIGRGLYFASLVGPRVWVGLTGLVIFLLMMVTGFIVYYLPWGQMSLWGATVITNLLSVLIWPLDITIVEWLWGGFTVTGITLNRFFSLHYLLPFVILALIIAHLYSVDTLDNVNQIKRLKLTILLREVIILFLYILLLLVTLLVTNTILYLLYFYYKLYCVMSMPEYILYMVSFVIFFFFLIVKLSDIYDAYTKKRQACKQLNRCYAKMAYFWRRFVVKLFVKNLLKDFYYLIILLRPAINIVCQPNFYDLPLFVHGLLVCYAIYSTWFWYTFFTVFNLVNYLNTHKYHLPLLNYICVPIYKSY